ncbi:MAG: hypothetical protein A2X61_16135 [Ignavibacteria bacterium GWB2_35_12]|nr:MAG: hypothetical protein A2X61_16135 [Ignavibacteria bacterium GWB2_35_12]OGU91432.1 MAG: hypothetical protein A2220_08610 [Ignavibacteria bacterium RIFOXYA2_FULL_35_10]OGV22218.1 MAG: hypothetical protein A2475_06910 [Ignavibacteria bacterium RIFOXYC2_FULL_35_21]
MSIIKGLLLVKEKCNILPHIEGIIAVLAILLFLSSCSSTSKNIITWNVELKEAEMPITDRCNPNAKLQSIKSAEKPMLLPADEEREGRVRVLGVPCAPNEDPQVYDVPVSRVRRITYVSDPLQPPSQVEVNELELILGCCRQREGFALFDKFELRGALGYRGTQEEYYKPGVSTPFKSSFFGFDEGGSTMIIGLEIAGLWDVPFIDKNGNFQLGFISGLWPFDGSLFIPIGLHGRYTFNQHPPTTSDNCNSWFLYGNFGLPLDFQTEAPIFGKSLDFQRYFYGLGIGYDWAITCSMDFSVDLGFRAMNLPLPPCTSCPSTPSEDKNPYRNSKVLLLRFGLTF